MTFLLIFAKKFASMTPILFQRQSFLSLITTPKKSMYTLLFKKKSFLREKICQYLNFGKIFYVVTFCAQACLQEASKKGTRVGFEIRTKNWPKRQEFQNLTILTPPTLAKSATKLDSIKKLTKGLFLISPIPGRMQKFREIVCADREKGIRIFSGFIYVTTTRTGQGPYPALNDNECTNSDHLDVRCFAARQVFGQFVRRCLC